MKNSVSNRKLLSNSFDKMHSQLSIIRSHVERLNDAQAERLLEQMEHGLLSAMRRLRLFLDIPYDWHDGAGH